MTVGVDSAPSCSRHALEAGTSRYLATLSTGELGWLQTILAENATYSENLIQTDMKHSTLSQTVRIDYKRTTVDKVQCATYTELLATDAKNPLMIATQIRFDAQGSKITKVDSIVTTNGDLLFNATHALHYFLADDWTPIPASKRDDRQTLQAAADSYFDIFVNKSVVVPWGKPCLRIEGGFLDANGTCETDIPDITVLTKDRRYVIDESIGSVNIVSNFGILGPDSHEFRILGGKIHSIHTMTLCRPNLNCGLAPPEQLSQDVGF